LIEDLQFLVQSLGGIGRIKEKWIVYNGERRMYYRMGVKLPPQFIPFKLSRKVERYKPVTKYLPSRAISKIEYVGKHENAAEKIERILVTDYKIVHNYRYCAFIHYFIGDLSGPIWFKKSIFFILFNLDNLLIKSKICKGNLRFMAAQKI
jgi:hypothetical protein